MTVSPPTDFPAADSYQSVQPGLLFSLSPMMMLGLVVLLILAGALGWMMARRQAPTDDPCDGIYDAIRKAIAAASGAPRDQVVASGRRLRSVIDARLGAVLTLGGGLAGPCSDLDTALKGIGTGDPHHDDHDSEHGTKATPIPGLVIHAQRDVIVHGIEPAKADHGEGNDEGHAKGHGEGHSAPGKSIDAATQIADIRAAVHALSDHWTDKSARLKELRAARSQLTAASERTGERVWSKS